jgi:hypothetical protein
VESDARFYRRRANEELAAASRAVTDAARERRIKMAEVFLDRLKALEAEALAELSMSIPDPAPAFKWKRARSVEHA